MKRFALGRKTSLGPVRDRFWVSAETGSGSSVWEVTEDRVVSCERLPEDAFPVLNFDHHDLRVPVTKRMSTRQARSTARRETGLESRVITGARAMYARPVEQMPIEGHTLVPGYQVIDHLTEMEDARQIEEHEKGRVIGLLLGSNQADAGGPDAPLIMVLYAVNRFGKVSQPQFSVNPYNVGEVLSEFCANNDLDALAGDLDWLKERDIFAMIPHLRAYPREDMMLGMSRTAAERASLGVACAALVGVAGFAAYQYASGVVAVASTLVVRAETLGAEKRRADLVRNHIVGMGQLLSIDTTRLFEYAEAVWQDGSVVKIIGDNRMVHLTVTARMDQTPKGQGDPRFAPAQIEHERVTALISREPPKGLTLTNVAITGETDGFEVKYSYEPLGALGRRFGGS